MKGFYHTNSSTRLLGGDENRSLVRLPVDVRKMAYVMYEQAFAKLIHGQENQAVAQPGQRG
jgi:hypothetical protein